MNAHSPTVGQFPLAASLGLEANSSFRRTCRRWVAGLGFAGLALVASPAWSQAVPLGTAGNFGVLGASGVSNTGPSVITGDLGIDPNNAASALGFTFSTIPGPGSVIGATHFADGVSLQAQNDLTAAFTTLTGRACNTTVTSDLATFLGGVLTPGVYCAPVASSMGLTGTLTLDALGDPDAVFIF